MKVLGIYLLGVAISVVTIRILVRLGAVEPVESDSDAILVGAVVVIWPLTWIAGVGMCLIWAVGRIATTRKAQP